MCACFNSVGGLAENATVNTTVYKCCSGLCIDLLNMLSEKIGLEFDLFEVPDRKFGSYEKTGPKVLSALVPAAFTGFWTSTFKLIGLLFISFIR